jgi:hypothetical protein
MRLSANSQRHSSPQMAFPINIISNFREIERQLGEEDALAFTEVGCHDEQSRRHDVPGLLDYEMRFSAPTQ